jgi:hypothetical protein
MYVCNKSTCFIAIETSPFGFHEVGMRFRWLIVIEFIYSSRTKQHMKWNEKYIRFRTIIDSGEFNIVDVNSL